ncbi:MAG TPA: DUF58 domain-containing protein [Oleiagrimonas sp.]|nr:DUF58 domain-containing protein [Oleiagrimonas sp.]
MSLTPTHAPVRDDSARISVRRDELIALRRRVMHARLRPLRHVAAAAAGSHASRQRGRGMDYLESRAYLPGDDVRHLDWRLTARRGHLHTKVFQEEHEHSVMLVLDTHASMRFGTRERFKSVQAARACAMMAWHVARSGARVGALGFGPCREVQRAKAGTRGALAVCAALARWDALAANAGNRAEPLSTAMRRMQPHVRGNSHVVVVTDGCSGDAHMPAALAAWRRHVHVSVLLVTDPIETDMPPSGRYPVANDGRRSVVDLTDAHARETFHQALAAPAGRLHEACRGQGIACGHVHTCADPLEAVVALSGLVGRVRR